MLVNGQNKIEIQEVCFRGIHFSPLTTVFGFCYQNKKAEEEREEENTGTASATFPYIWAFPKHFVFLAQHFLNCN